MLPCEFRISEPISEYDASCLTLLVQTKPSPEPPSCGGIGGMCGGGIPMGSVGDIGGMGGARVGSAPGTGATGGAAAGGAAAAKPSRPAPWWVDELVDEMSIRQLHG